MFRNIILLILFSLAQAAFAQSKCDRLLAETVLSRTTFDFWSTLNKDEQISVLSRFEAFANKASGLSPEETQARLRWLIEFTLTGAVQTGDGVAWSSAAFRELADAPKTVPEVRVGLLELAKVFSREF